MMNFKFYITVFCLSLMGIAIGCTNNNKKKQEGNILPKPITLPEIPSIITTLEGRVNYVMEHFWDTMDFTDTAYIHYPDITEQGIVDYIDLLNRSTDSVLINKSIDRFFTRIETDTTGKVVRYFTQMLTKYLREPNSPFRNETVFAKIAQNILKSNHPEFNSADKDRAQFDVDAAAKNSKGSIAADFSFEFLSGKQSSLYQFKSDKTLLFFYDPDCSSCKEYVEIIKKEPKISSLITTGVLTILAIYVDQDYELWQREASKLPESWSVAIDRKGEINDKQLYILEASPTLYLLDKDKRVILKDAMYEQLLEWLNANL